MRHIFHKTEYIIERYYELRGNRGENMEQKDYPKINTLQIHYFLEVAEKGSFTSAAKQLYTTQSTLSKTIISIEQTLGITLFIRSHKRLILTDAGRHLYEKWQKMLEDFDHSIEECRILQSGYRSMLSIGMLDSHDPEKFALPQIREFTQYRPDIYLSIHSYPVEEIGEQVISGHLDLGYTVLYDVEQLQEEELSYCIINICPHNVGMLSGNPLVQKELIEISDLQDCKFVSISPLYTPSYKGMIDDLCREAGFEPDYVRYTNNATSLPYNLMSERDVFLCDRNFRGYVNPSFGELQFRPIANTKSGVSLIWRKANTKPELKEFIEHLNVNPDMWF